jgi:hypothetical protein
MSQVARIADVSTMVAYRMQRVYEIESLAALARRAKLLRAVVLDAEARLDPFEQFRLVGLG